MDPATKQGHPATAAELRQEDGHPMVLAYRLGQVERGQADILNKLELIASNYPTIATMQLILDPIKDKVKEMEEQHKEEEKSKTMYTAQLKLAVTAAALSPVVSFVIVMILNRQG